MKIVIFEKKRERFYPISILHWVGDIKTGIYTFFERIKRVYNKIEYIIYTDGPYESLLKERGFRVNEPVEGDVLLIEAGYRLDNPFPYVNVDTVFTDEAGHVVGAFIHEGTSSLHLSKSLSRIKHRVVVSNGRYYTYIFDTIKYLSETLLMDGISSSYPEMDGLYVDERDGNVFISPDVVIEPPVFIKGPAYIGRGCVLSGARIYSSYIGDVCKIGGEVESSIFHGYVNKHHKGFIGHSYIGEWVNLGALTTNSDLKNNYSHVRFPSVHGIVDTGSIKIGAFIGDHTKTGIGTLINTGSYIGIFSNIWGGYLIDKFIPSFRWGKERYYIDKALKTAERVMNRRGEILSDAYIALIKHIFSVYENRY